MVSQKLMVEKKLCSTLRKLRNKININDYRDYILGIFCYKFMSKKVEDIAKAHIKQTGITFKEAYKLNDYKKNLEKKISQALGFFVEPKYLFQNIADKGRNGELIIEDLGKAFENIEQSMLGLDSEMNLSGIFENVDLSSSKLGKTINDKNNLIINIVESINEIDSYSKCTEIDIQGDIYEYLIEQFAFEAGKKAGEFYTPKQVSKLLAKIVTTNKTKLRNVYDPTCGSGSLLLRVKQECKVENLYGQEINPITHNLARMNVLVHNVSYNDFEIAQGDTLEHPQHLHKKFEAVVANPPFSAKWSAYEKFLEDDRFSQSYKLPPKSKADFAFLLHMIYHLDNNGTLAIVLPHGVLFRGADEGLIRKHLIKENNYLDAVIGLPINLFFGTGIPSCILVFKKCRSTSDDILFIDASRNFEKANTRNTLNEEHINKIVNTYEKRCVIEKYSKSVTLEEIQENNYNLNIPRYIDAFEEEDEINLQQVANSIIEIDREIKEIDKEIKEFCDELGIKAPIL